MNGPLRTLLRPALGALAALVLVVGGLVAFVATDAPAPDDSPATPLPPISIPLGPHWLTPSPER
ncbi:hypothetical protein VMT65_17935 [Nocardia sp. CDC153]|uniref:hypothetical protein n=1 Tax=Nocardia sp. CDC153 TaxID=3112167 RepID=UPI002DBEE6FD|nr:hypothetical protein [Nocardia sp. CDC153]MEC3954926.1 hypothetical protein [Nocardia sp. CDC153]